MPYLDSKIELNKHKKACVNPVGKRLYIRDYDEMGKQRFVPWGLTCTSCGVVVKEGKYEPSLTPKELEYVELEKKLEGSEYSKIVESISGGKPKMSIEDQLKRKRAYKIADKLKRLQVKGHPPITPKERSLRVRLYKLEGYRNYQLGAGRQYRPNALCKKFLNLNPRPTMQELYEALYPLKYDIYKRNKYRRFKIIPDLDPNRPNVAGRINLKRDYSDWIPDPENPEQMIWNPDPNFKTDWDKTVEEDSRLRKEVMKRVIKSRGEKVPEVKTEKK
jgi:hypothetical protein